MAETGYGVNLKSVMMVHELINLGSYDLFVVNAIMSE